MKINIKKLSQGFTIVEVMIVLAIAGLILAIVFIAVPQLQRNARDNQRENIVSRLKSELETYASNNQGTYPFNSGSGTGSWNDFYTRYISGGKVNIKDPSTGNDVAGANSGTPSTFTVAGCSNATCSNLSLPANAGDFLVAYGAKCSGENLVQSGSNSVSTHNYATVIGLDRSGTRFCVDNG